MANVFKKLVAASAVSGAGFGAFKLYQEYNMVKDVYNNIIVGAGEKLIYDDLFEGDSVGAFGAGVEIDMRDVEIEDSGLNLDLYGMGAGYRVMVPSGVQVVLNGVSRMSSVQSDLEEGITGLILNINYDLTLSGLMVIAVSSKKDVEETQEPSGKPSEKEKVVTHINKVSEETLANVQEVLNEAQENIPTWDSEGHNPIDDEQ